MSARFLSSDDLEGIASPVDFVDAVREGYRQRGEGALAEPRTALRSSEQRGMLTGYLAVLPETGVMGGYTYAAGFGARDAWFVTPLFDADSGEPLAVLDGAWLNPFKTGAAGAVAVDELAREDADSLALVGTGSQARGQLRATATVRDFQTVEVFSPTPSHRESFAAEFDERIDADVSTVESADDAVDGADVVITATTSSEPVFDAEALADGAHVTAMGQYHPERRELDHATIERAVYVPDLRERVLQDAGSFISALDAGVVDEAHVAAELGDVVAGEHPGRTSPDDVTVFDSGGTGIETVAGAYCCYERAEARDLGVDVDFAPASEAMLGS